MPASLKTGNILFTLIRSFIFVRSSVTSANQSYTFVQNAIAHNLHTARLTLHCLSLSHSHVTLRFTSPSSSYSSCFLSFPLFFFVIVAEGCIWWRMHDSEEDGGKVLWTGYCLFPLKPLTGSIPSFRLLRSKDELNSS